MFYTADAIGLSVMAFVPNTSTIYPLLGRPHDALQASTFNLSFPSYLGPQFDASSTNLSFAIRSSDTNQPILIDISFLSPITPTSTLRQSIPASYLTITATGDTDVHIYIDINGQWVSGDRNTNITWSMQLANDTNTPLRSWAIKRDTEDIFAEYNDRAEWGTLLLTAPDEVEYQSGDSGILRQQFSRTGHCVTPQIIDTGRSWMRSLLLPSANDFH